MRSLVAELDDLPDVRDAIERTLVDEPPALARDGGFTRDGVDAELDELRRSAGPASRSSPEMEERERARTGIASLKIRYNRVFGYYIEISKSNLHAVPPDYHRKQTIAGGERFITPALKEYEEKVLGADERIVERELEIFERAARGGGRARRRGFRRRRARSAALDVARRAGRGRGRQQLHEAARPRRRRDDRRRRAPSGRRAADVRGRRTRSCPNDITLNGTTRQLVILTGPNMGGKSTYLRQTALLCVMAQVGLVRAGARSQDAARRSHLRARRRVRQHRARPVDVHGRDAGNGAHPPHRDVAQPRRARRNRPRHGDLRRPEHRVGGRRVSRHESAACGRRRSSRRTITS